jgi:transcriptional regulator with XRE-family HTH domain
MVKRRYNRQRADDGIATTIAMELRLKQLRREAGLTQEQLAERAGLSRNYLSQIENGVRTPNVTRLQQIAKALNTDFVNLLANPEQDLRSLRLISALEGAEHT